MMITFLDGSQREVALTPGANLRGANLIGAARGVATGFKKAKELPLP